MKRSQFFSLVLGIFFLLPCFVQAKVSYSIKGVYVETKNDPTKLNPNLEAQLDSLQRMGIEYVFESTGMRVSSELYRQFLDLAQRYGRKVILNLCNEYTWNSFPWVWPKERVEAFVEPIKNHPAFVATWPVNEWNINADAYIGIPLSGELAKEAYAHLKEILPDKDVIMTIHYHDWWDWHNDPDHINHQFADGQCDILCFNWYTNWSDDGKNLYFGWNVIRDEGEFMLGTILEIAPDMRFWIGLAIHEEKPEFLPQDPDTLDRDIQEVLELVNKGYAIEDISFFCLEERYPDAGVGFNLFSDYDRELKLKLMEVITSFTLPHQNLLSYAYLGPKNFIPGNPDPGLSDVFAGRYKRIILAFVWPDENGRLKYYENIRMDILPQLSQNGIDFAVSLGGEGTSSGFKSLADPVKMKRFLGELEVFAANHSIKKADIDWEFPVTGDGETLLSLINGLKGIFESVSLIVPYQDWTSSFPDTALRAADEIFVMLYPQAGLWNKYASHINALDGPDFSVKKSLHYWMDDRHVPSEKMLLGLGYYGFAYYGVSQLGQPLPPNPRGDFVTNFEIQRRWGHLPVQWDIPRQVPYITVGDTLVVFDNQQSYELKIAYAEGLGLKGVFYWQIGQEAGQFDTSVNSRENPMPEFFELRQNYPNPFNPTTTIEYALPKPAFVTLKIYNILGEEVATLIAEKQDAGVHYFIWDASRFASGIYLYRLEAADFVQVKKLILVR